MLRTFMTYMHVLRLILPTGNCLVDSCTKILPHGVQSPTPLSQVPLLSPCAANDTPLRSSFVIREGA